MIPVSAQKHEIPLVGNPGLKQLTGAMICCMLHRSVGVAGNGRLHNALRYH